MLSENQSNDQERSKDGKQHPQLTQMYKYARRGWKEKILVAFAGIREGVRGQTSFFVHLPVGALVIVLSLWLSVSLVEVCLLLLCVGVVLGAELFNSSLEWLSRAVTNQADDRIRRALDIASGAVLTLAITAAIAGGLIFGRALWALAY